MMSNAINPFSTIVGRKMLGTFARAERLWCSPFTREVLNGLHMAISMSRTEDRPPSLPPSPSRIVAIGIVGFHA
jgi:hypothetical protein